MAQITLLFRIDVGFDPRRGYAATVYDIPNDRMKGIRGNSIQQITSRLRHVLNEEMEKKRDFPLESEPSRLIIP